MRRSVASLSWRFRCSIAWDQGAEMADYADFTPAIDIPIDFCESHSPCQRGSNEKTNDLLRQYRLKGTDP